MSRVALLSILVVSAALLAAALWMWCSESGPYAEQIRQLRSANIEDDVEMAVAKGDLRLVAVMEEGLSVPGVPEGTWSRFGVWVIPNTTDAIESAEHRQLQEVARVYAQQYNKSLLRRLGQ